ncbi:MAG: hypothetical protein HA496_07300 [Thaumarchaeota archaeon]|nr:hypothetical protein [Nitrososphaerota archaeon]
MEKFRILYFISGILFLAVSAAGGSWWELVAGEASKPVLYVGLSPFEFRVELLGARAVNPSPLMNAFFTSERLLALLGSATVIIGSLLPGKPWSRRLLNLRPLTMPVFFGILTIALTTVLATFVQSFAPSVAQALPNLAEALTPYSGKYLTINLYPFTGVNGSVKISTESRFTVQFWTALVSGVFCLAGWVLGGKKDLSQALPPQPEPSGAPNKVENPSSLPAQEREAIRVKVETQLASVRGIKNP